MSTNCAQNSKIITWFMEINFVYTYLLLISIHNYLYNRAINLCVA